MMCLTVYPKSHKSTWWVSSFSCTPWSISLCNLCVRAWFQGLDAVCSVCVINRLRNSLQVDMYRIMCRQYSLTKAIPMHQMDTLWCPCNFMQECRCRYFCILCWNTKSRRLVRFSGGFALHGVKSGIFRFGGICRDCFIFLGSFVPNSVQALDTLDFMGDELLHNIDWHFDLFGFIMPTVKTVVSQLVTDRVADVKEEYSTLHLSELC